MAAREEETPRTTNAWTSLSEIHEMLASSMFFRTPSSEDTKKDFMERLGRHFDSCRLLDHTKEALDAFRASREALLDSRANQGYTYGKPLGEEEATTSRLYQPSSVLPLVFNVSNQHPLRRCSPFEILAYAHHVSQAYKDLREVNKTVARTAYTAREQVARMQAQIAKLEKENEELASEEEARLRTLHELFDQTEATTLPDMRRALEALQTKNAQQEESSRELQVSLTKRERSNAVLTQELTSVRTQLEEMRAENAALLERLAVQGPRTHNRESQTIPPANLDTQETQTTPGEHYTSHAIQTEAYKTKDQETQTTQSAVFTTQDQEVQAVQLEPDWIDEEVNEKLRRDLRSAQEKHKQETKNWIKECDTLRSQIATLEKQPHTQETVESRDNERRAYVAQLTQAHDRIKQLQVELQNLRTSTGDAVQTLSRTFATGMQDLVHQARKGQATSSQGTDPANIEQEVLTQHAMALVSMYSEKERSLQQQLQELEFAKQYTETENQRMLALLSQFFPPLLRLTCARYPQINGDYVFDRHALGLRYVASINVGPRAGTQNTLSRHATNVWHLQTNVQQQPNAEGNMHMDMFTLVASFNHVLPLGQVQAWTTQQGQDPFEIAVHVLDPNLGIVYGE
jgi:hypothetical protein